MADIKYSFKSRDEIPFGKSIATEVERSGNGYWIHIAERRSAGLLPDAPLHEMLTWVLDQITFGHISEAVDTNGDVVNLSIGKSNPIPASKPEEMGELGGKALFGLGLTGAIAESREKGCHPKTYTFEGKVWDDATPDFRLRTEIYYGYVLCELLGRVSQNLPQLELLPILDSAPENTLNNLAEATRCFLLKLDRACIALCRACLEDSLNHLVKKEPLKSAYQRELSKKKSSLEVLINFCDSHGLLGNHARNAHYIRIQGNNALHGKANSKQAREVLARTRKLTGYIHGKKSSSP